MKTKRNPCTARGLTAGLLALGVGIGGAASAVEGTGTDPLDPFESFNRGVFQFNDAVDRAVLKPVATGYRGVTPDFFRTGVDNFFSNLSEPWSLVNNLVQGRVQDAGETFIRFSVNTVLGLGGTLDIASELGVRRHRQDFGRTLAFYGAPAGPYLVLPVLGPSTVRGVAALPVDTQGNLLSSVDDVGVRNALFALRIVDGRARLLSASNLLDEAALDRYSFIRDAYLQRAGRRDAGDAAR